ncbi:MAG TPA: acetyl-CoA carboxylase biotin carboxyl carrier protein [Trueperaceae bacterium]|nr:acetyl-CoA carboxylase biotin carboxyl carrier protein [Trueperaceae bacterium]
MNVKDIGRLLEAMQATNSNELSLETGDYKLTINRSQTNTVVSMPEPIAQVAQPMAIVQEQVQQAEVVVSSPEPIVDSNLIDITAPIVGTFYEAPAPDASPFVKLGAKVEVGTVLCIIEAMKLMNEIESEYSGTIAEILINNEDPVEYGQVLFRIKPD